MSYCSDDTFTDYLEETLVKHVVNESAWSGPSALYLAVGSISGSTEPFTFTELSGSTDKGYERRRVYFSTPFLTPAVTGSLSMVNRNPVVLGPAMNDWTTFTAFAVFDQATGGNMFCWGLWDSIVTVKEAKEVVYSPGVVEIRVRRESSGGWSKYLTDKAMRLAFRSEGFTPPTWYAALCGSQPAWDGGASSLNEPNDPAYGRVQITAWTAVAQSGNAAVTKNDSGGQYGLATVDWFGGQFVTHLAFADATTGGNLLGDSSLSISQTVLACDWATVVLQGYQIALK
jgi:hypothetical protein